jgi:hypothetical protein
MFAVRPELDRVRTYAKPSPTRRSRHFPAFVLPSEARELNEQDGLLCREPDQYEQANLRIHVIVEPPRPSPDKTLSHTATY